MKTPQADALILFGVTGDLARRRLFPALYELEAAGELNIAVFGVGRTKGDESSLRGWATEALTQALDDVDRQIQAQKVLSRQNDAGMCHEFVR